MRLFVGTFIKFPERKSIELFQANNVNVNLELKNGATIKWSAAPKLHITWCFLGDVDAGKVSQVTAGIKSALQELKLRGGDEVPPTSMRFTRMAFWPKAKFPNIVVLRPDTTDNYYVELAKLIGANTIPFVKVAGEQKDFRAHITLARIKHRRPSDLSDASEGFDASEGLDRIADDTAEDKRCSENSGLSGLNFRDQEQLFPLEVKINSVELIESSQKIEGCYRSIKNFYLI